MTSTCLNGRRAGCGHDSMITDSFVGRIGDVYAGDGRFYLPDEFSGDVKVLNPRLDCNLNGICDPDEEGDCNNNGIPDVPCDARQQRRS